MTTTKRVLWGLAAVLLALYSNASAASIESFGMISAGVGAERETGASSGCTNVASANARFEDNGGEFHPHACAGNAGARGMASVLGVLPFAMQGVGLQWGAGYNGGAGSRFGAKLGPIFGWAGGKAGAILDYQYRTQGGGSHFFWLTPAVSLYLGNMNVNLSYTQPISSAQESNEKLFDNSSGEMVNRYFTRYTPTNRLQGSVSYFPINSFEINLGAQVNTFFGNTKDIRSAGVGPVFGLAWMPMQNVELNLVKGTIDNRSRYNVQSGVSWVFNAGSAKGTDLKEIRRKYLQTPEPSVAIAGPYTRYPGFNGCGLSC